MSIHVCKCVHSGKEEFHLRYPGMSKESAQEIASKINAGRLDTPRRSTGWIAPKDHYAFPVLFNPYSGKPRDAEDIASDPQGVLLRPPGALLQAFKEPK